MPTAKELLAARARRVRLVRQRVVAAALASFVLLWGVVAFDGAKGESTTVASTPTTTSSSSSDSSSDWSGGSATSAPDAATPMTTSQS